MMTRLSLKNESYLGGHDNSKSESKERRRGIKKGEKIEDKEAASGIIWVGKPGRPWRPPYYLIVPEELVVLEQGHRFACNQRVKTVSGYQMLC